MHRGAFLAAFTFGLLTPTIYSNGLKPLGRLTGRTLLIKVEQIQIANSHDNSRRAAVVAVNGAVFGGRAYEVYLLDNGKNINNSSPILAVIKGKRPTVAWDGGKILRIQLACGQIEYFTNHWRPRPNTQAAVEITLTSNADQFVSGSSLECIQS
jgi:hypothetical protein